MRVEVENITPSLAAEYLTNNLPNNRSISRRWVAKIVTLMKSDNWSLNGESIKFGFDPKEGKDILIDGQHRLAAIVEAGISVEMLVVRGLPMDSFKTIDSGRKRQAHDVLRIMGYGQSTLLAAGLRLLYKYSKDPFLNNLEMSVATVEMLDLFKEHPHMMTSVAMGHRGRFIVPGSFLVWLHYVVYQSGHTALIDDFCLKLSDGISMVSGDPVLTLRERVFRIKATGARINRRYHFGMLVKTWNSVYNGEDVKKLRFKPDEDIPKVEGVDYQKLFGIPHMTKEESLKLYPAKAARRKVTRASVENANQLSLIDASENAPSQRTTIIRKAGNNPEIDGMSNTPDHSSAL